MTVKKEAITDGVLRVLLDDAYWKNGEIRNYTFLDTKDRQSDMWNAQAYLNTALPELSSLNNNIVQQEEQKQDAYAREIRRQHDIRSWTPTFRGPSSPLDWTESTQIELEIQTLLKQRSTLVQEFRQGLRETYPQMYQTILKAATHDFITATDHQGWNGKQGVAHAILKPGEFSEAIVAELKKSASTIRSITDKNITAETKRDLGKGAEDLLHVSMPTLLYANLEQALQRQVS
jgi:cation transport regulator ChaB